LTDGLIRIERSGSYLSQGISQFLNPATDKRVAGFADSLSTPVPLIEIVEPKVLIRGVEAYCMSLIAGKAFAVQDFGVRLGRD